LQEPGKINCAPMDSSYSSITLVVYHSLTIDQMVSGTRGMGMPEMAIGCMPLLYSVVPAGHAAGVISGFEKATGRKPITFETCAERAVTAWK
jgi:hypothetical protein